MGNPPPKPDLIKEYLDRVRARDRSTTLEEYSSRLIHLSTIKGLLSSLLSEGFIVEEGPTLLRSTGEPEPRVMLHLPDFVVTREDVVFYLYLSMGPHLRMGLPLGRALSDTLRSNPNLSAVVLAWPDGEYTSVVIDSFSIRNCLERADPVDLSLESAAPLLQAIRDFFTHQFVDWKLPEDVRVLRLGGGGAPLSEIFSNNLLESFRTEMSRAFGIREKTEAQESITLQDIEQIASKALNFIRAERVTRESFAEIDSLLERLKQG
jgi:hypothetical protein